jgi:mRNA interferase MazF
VDFERFAVVRVPFPFTDRTAKKNRPAQVLSDVSACNSLAGRTMMATTT